MSLINVAGFDGIQVNELGEVYNNGVKLKIQKMSHGYLRVQVATRKRETVHKLVALAFFGPVPKGKEVRHLNGIRSDNRIENLKYGTRKENLDDRVLHGTSNRGSNHGLSKLKAIDVIDIKSRIKAGETNKHISDIYNVDASTISNIKTGRLWSHLSEKYNGI